MKEKKMEEEEEKKRGEEAADSDRVVHEKAQILSAGQWSHVCVRVYAYMKHKPLYLSPLIHSLSFSGKRYTDSCM